MFELKFLRLEFVCYINFKFQNTYKEIVKFDVFDFIQALYFEGSTTS